VGSAATIPVDIRIVAATNQDLAAMVQAKHFRRDLYYRLNEFSLTLTPLRDRGEDVAFLANRFLEMTRTELKKEVSGFTEEALQLLVSHKWPGNVRELRNVIRRAVLLCDDAQIRPDHLAPFSNGEPASATAGTSDEELPPQAGLKDLVRSGVAHIEREAIAKALKKARGNKAEAARILKVDYKTLHTKVKEYGLLRGNEPQDEQEQ
jgi:two-component system nitrogen regulation response regulator GlnG